MSKRRRKKIPQYLDYVFKITWYCFGKPFRSYREPEEFSKKVYLFDNMEAKISFLSKKFHEQSKKVK